MLTCFLLEPVPDSDSLWKAPDGAVYQLGTVSAHGVPPAPPGAMWDASWLTGLSVCGARPFGGPDGRTFIVRTPGGDWVIDGPSFRDGEPVGLGWTRTGEPPRITVTPSIVLPGYHAWLRDGSLIPV